MSIEIENTEKPSDAAIAAYKSALEDLLSPYGIGVAVEVYNEPLLLTSTVNGEITRKVNIWIRPISVSSEGAEPFAARLNGRKSISENEDPINIWLDAVCIQSQFCSKQNLPRDDKFYSLWDRRKEINT